MIDPLKMMVLAMAGWTMLFAVQDESEAGMGGISLPPCPGSPNCVSSEEGAGPARVEPLRFNGSSVLAWRSLQQAIRDMGGTVTADDGHSLRAFFATRLFRFVDDMNCRLDEGGRCIHVRSASRVGYWDLGVNRRRVETLRKRFVREQAAAGENAGDR